MRAQGGARPEVSRVRIDPNLTRIGTGSSTDRVGSQRLEGRSAGVRDVPGQASGGDEAVLSPRAQDVRLAQRALAEVPEVRQDKVEALRQQIAEGTFEVDAELIADRLIQGGL